MRTAILVMLCTAAAGVALADDLPRAAPPFMIQRAGAPPIQLSQFKGKIVALILMNPTCPHCQALTNTVAPLAREYGPKGVQFLECAFNPTAERDLGPFVQQFQPAFPVGWSNDPAVRAFLGYSPTDGRLSYVPHMVFLDGRGMIRDDFPADSELFKNPETNIRAELEKLLKTPSAGAPSAAARKK